MEWLPLPRRNHALQSILLMCSAIIEHIIQRHHQITTCHKLHHSHSRKVYFNVIEQFIIRLRLHYYKTIQSQNDDRLGFFFFCFDMDPIVSRLWRKGAARFTLLSIFQGKKMRARSHAYILIHPLTPNGILCRTGFARVRQSVFAFVGSVSPVCRVWS